MNIPITGTSLAFDGLAFLVAAMTIHVRIKKQDSVAGAAYIRNFFFAMALFSLWIAATHAALISNAEQFPKLLGVAYTYGHTIMYLGFLYLWLLIFSVAPQYAKWRKLAVFLWLAANAAVTAVTHLFTISEQSLGYQSNRLTDLNGGNIVGGSIAALALLAFIPVIIIFSSNAVQAKGKQRIKPLLIAGGFLLMTVGGPMHDVAGNWQMFLLADIVSTVSIIILVSGVLYRPKQA